jgi:ankyrin repeat protein
VGEISLCAVRPVQMAGGSYRGVGSVCSALYMACAGGHDEVAEHCIGSGATVGFEHALTRMTPLHIASLAGHSSTVSLLLSANADPEANTASGLRAWDLATKSR